MFSVLIVFFCMKSCDGENNNYIEKTDTIFSIYTKDTIVYREKIKYIPQLITVIEHDTILQFVDTAKILKEYFSTKVYVDSIIDSLLLVIVTDTISENEIKNRSYSVRQTIRVIENEKIVDRTKTQKFNIGAGIDFDISEKFNLTPKIQMKYKKHGASVGYNISDKTIRAGYVYYIK